MLFVEVEDLRRNKLERLTKYNVIKITQYCIAEKNYSALSFFLVVQIRRDAHLICTEEKKYALVYDLNVREVTELACADFCK